MTSKAERAAEVAAILSTEPHANLLAGTTRHPAHIVARDVIALLRIGAKVKGWAVRACNGEGHRVAIPRGGFQSWSWEWGEDDEAAKNRADAKALAKANEIAARYGATVTIGGDPRGYVLRLVLASGRSNTMGNDGWGIA